MIDFVTLAEGITASDYALKNLNKALGEAQLEFAPAVKGEENTYGGYNYTPLIAIVTAVRPALVKNSLTVSQFPITDLERRTVSLVTRLVHSSSAEWVQSVYEMPGDLALGKGGEAKFNQQTIGGSITYAQKYAYKAIVGIPDSEEMIDSTEEKGDTPARPAKNVKAEAEKRAAAERTKMAEAQGICSYSGETEILHCKIIGIQKKQTKATDKAKPRDFRSVTFNGRLPNGANFASCFDTELWEPLDNCLDKECKLKVAIKGAYANVTDVVWIHGVGADNELDAHLAATE